MEPRYRQPQGDKLALPKQVVLGTQVWEIVERNRNKDGMLSEDSYGYTLQKENLIVIDTMIAESRKKQTLFHEIMHALRHTYGNPTMPKKTDSEDLWEHYFIGAWETSLIMVFRDNPKVLAYLIWE
jgi:hypothetical protein